MKFINENALPVINAFAGAFSDKDSGLSSALSNVVEVVKSYVMPIFEGAVSVFNKVRDAISDNIESFKSFFEVVKFIAPIIGELIGGSLKVVGEIASAVITVIAKVLAAIKPLLNTAIDGINLVIRGLNLINPFADIPYLPRIGDSFATGGAPGAISGGGSSTFADLSALSTLSGLNGTNTTTTTNGVSTAAKVAASTAASSNNIVSSNFNPGSFRLAEARTMGTVVNNFTITGAIDKEGTARTVNDLLNDSYYRGTNGALNLAGLRL
jgi:hypothetical protein